MPPTTDMISEAPPAKVRAAAPLVDGVTAAKAEVHGAIVSTVAKGVESRGLSSMFNRAAISHLAMGMLELAVHNYGESIDNLAVIHRTKIHVVASDQLLAFIEKLAHDAQTPPQAGTVKADPIALAADETEATS